MSSNFKISGQERRDLKKLLNEYKAYEKGFWHYHQLDKDMCAFITPIGGMQKDTKAYPMSDEEAQKRYDKLLSDIDRISKQLEEKAEECPSCHKVGFHKLSCPTQKVTFWYDSDSFIKTEMAIDNEMRKRFIDKATELQERYDNDYLKMQELISKEANVVTEEDLKRMRRCKNHVWRKNYLNGGKVCQVCGKAKETPTTNKDVEE
jgi:translation elongation factor EF-G